MAITPAGSPSWVRNADPTTYGGNTEKRNYMGQAVCNAQTDVGAEQYVRLAADVAGMVRANPFCVIRGTATDASSSVYVEACIMQTGVAAAYAGASPPSGFPTVAYSSSGVFTVTFASSYTDPYGVAGAYAPVVAVASCANSTSTICTTVIAGQAITVRAFTDTGVARANAAFAMAVW